MKKKKERDYRYDRNVIIATVLSYFQLNAEDIRSPYKQGLHQSLARKLTSFLLHHKDIGNITIKEISEYMNLSSRAVYYQIKDVSESLKWNGFIALCIEEIIGQLKKK